MSVHCITNDATSLVTLIIVYCAMILGNLVFLFSVGWSTFTGQIPISADCVVEIIIFEPLWLLMFWCHVSTMCREPGYIPFNYRYQREILPPYFKSLLETPIEESET